MNRYGTIIKCNGGYRVAPFYGEHLNSSSGDFTALMISRLDIDVKFVDLPPVQNHEIAELLRYKIRSIYPGKPEKTVFDYILFGKKNKRYAALYITQRDVIEAHRDLSEGKPLFHSLSLPHDSRCVLESAASRQRSRASSNPIVGDQPSSACTLPIDGILVRTSSL